ncbi:chemotaxis protein CheB [Hyalangium gracile]|uniref:chemotaxis protein CheB n=1 Tax=Hyalangium gracile TaxID=394092 RepID=UPI00295F3B05|nr:chemotaxis protein CheB [Hyalangium gracile]
MAQLPADLPASVCIVLHLAAEHRSVLPQILSRVGPLPAIHPRDGEPLEHGRIYVAPNDRHLLVEPGYVRVVKGPQENGHRPAVDPLFRSAARAYGPRVIGVVLTGARNCGTAGLLAVKALGGVAVVQDPEDAACADMPRSALEYVEVDHSVRLARMGPLLTRLVATPVRLTRKRLASPVLEHEVRLLEADARATNMPPNEGAPSHYSCPDCGGVLFEVDDTGLLRYRCRVGHGYTSEVLVEGQEGRVDAALWAAIRALEENAGLARRMASRARERNQGHTALRYTRRAEEAELQAQSIRQLTTYGIGRQGALLSPREGDGEGDNPERSS